MFQELVYIKNFPLVETVNLKSLSYPENFYNQIEDKNQVIWLYFPNFKSNCYNVYTLAKEYDRYDKPIYHWYPFDPRVNKETEEIVSNLLEESFSTLKDCLENIISCYEVRVFSGTILDFFSFLKHFGVQIKLMVVKE